MAKKLDIVFFDAGGGHRATATALKAICERQNRPWHARLVNIQEVLDPVDTFRRVFGIRAQDIYNKMLREGWTLGSAQGVKFVHAVAWTHHPWFVRQLAQLWRESSPDMVVSVIPNLNRAMIVALRSVCPRTPFVTVLTDLADFPPHFWIERASQYIVCGTPRASEQALAQGHARNRIFQTSGMVVHPDFCRTVLVDRAQERRRLGLDPERPTALVLFGGQGSKTMIQIARRLPRTQLIMVCGRNEELAQTLLSLPAAPAIHMVQGFTQDIPLYMRLADFFIGKPGSGSISEAVQMGLPVIVERNAWTLPQERYNTDWILQQGVGIVIPTFREIAAAAARMEANLDLYRQACLRIDNRAVYEVPEILDGLFAR